MRIEFAFSTHIGSDFQPARHQFSASCRRFCPLIADICRYATIVCKLKLLFQLYAITCKPKSNPFRLMPRYRVRP